MSRLLVQTLYLTVVLGLACACASSGPSSDFPSRKELKALGARPVPASLLDTPLADVRRWTFAEPAAEKVELVPHSERNPWSSLLQKTIGSERERVISTVGMHCAAHEVARFYAEKSGFPTQSLLNLMLARCGATVVDISPAFLHGQAPESLSEAEIAAQWRESTANLIRASIAKGLRNVGIAFARKGEDCVLVVLSGERRLEVLPFRPVADRADTVVIQGRLNMSAQGVSARITQGLYGVADCTSDPLLALPDFAVACRMAPGDDSARISVSALPPERLLSTNVLEVIARRSSEGERTYKRHRYAAPHEVSDGPDFRTAALNLINAVRRKADLAPLKLAVEQSIAAEEVAPHFLYSIGGEGDPSEADTIARGLLAGWDVPPTIRTADLTAVTVASTRDASQWLSTVLESPTGRGVLMNPEIELLAVGAVMTEEPVLLSAVVTSYDLFDASQHAEDGRQLFERIVEERGKRGLLLPPQRLAALTKDAEAQVERVHAGLSTPVTALQALLDQGVRRLNRSVQGGYAESNTLEELPLPRDVLRPDLLGLAVAVSHYRPRNEPWGRYVALFVFVGPN